MLVGPMEITIKAEAQEIAALVLAVQERRFPEVSLTVGGKEIEKSIFVVSPSSENPFQTP